MSMRIAFLYDCIYPYTIGGVERRLHEIRAPPCCPGA